MKGLCSSVSRSQCRVQGPGFRTTYLDHELSPFSQALAFKWWCGGFARGNSSLDFGLVGRVQAAFITGVLTLYLKAYTLRLSYKVVSSPRVDPVSVSF